MPGWLMEYTYSTPGTSRSSRSMGIVARCCTSAGVAPGMRTKTSSMGTTICGSSSRGVIRMAKAPASSAPAMNSGVSLELMKACATRPAMRSGVSRLRRHSLLSPPTRLPLSSCPAGSATTRSPAVEPGEHLNVLGGRLAEGDVAQAGDLVFIHHVHRVQLAAMQQSGLGNENGLPLAARETRAGRRDPSESADSQAIRF